MQHHPWPTHSHASLWRLNKKLAGPGAGLPPSIKCCRVNSAMSGVWQSLKAMTVDWTQKNSGSVTAGQTQDNCNMGETPSWLTFSAFTASVRKLVKWHVPRVKLLMQWKMFGQAAMAMASSFWVCMGSTTSSQTVPKRSQGFHLCANGGIGPESAIVHMSPQVSYIELTVVAWVSKKTTSLRCVGPTKTFGGIYLQVKKVAEGSKKIHGGDRRGGITAKRFNVINIGPQLNFGIAEVKVHIACGVANGHCYCGKCTTLWKTSTTSVGLSYIASDWKPSLHLGQGISPRVITFAGIPKWVTGDGQQRCSGQCIETLDNVYNSTCDGLIRDGENSMISCVWYHRCLGLRPGIFPNSVVGTTLRRKRRHCLARMLDQIR